MAKSTSPTGVVAPPESDAERIAALFAQIQHVRVDRESSPQPVEIERILVAVGMLAAALGQV